jgi:hypothetical protein
VSYTKTIGGELYVAPSGDRLIFVRRNDFRCSDVTLYLRALDMHSEGTKEET